MFVFSSSTPQTSYVFFLQIVCKFFIQAIESEKYISPTPDKPALSDNHCYRFGWFWECPNGESCQYRHALPPGFVLKSQKKAAEEAEKANTISLEEFLEVEVSIVILQYSVGCFIIGDK